MSDLISRQAAIDALDGKIEITGRTNAEAVKGYVRLVKDRLERLPSARPEPIKINIEDFNKEDWERLKKEWGNTPITVLPSAQPEPQWIPVSERLPEVGKDVMVCYDFKGHRSVLIGVLYGDEKFHGYDDEYLTPEGRKYRKAVAWMPLPEPYREERTEE